jgi:hypothetical protein
MESAKKLWWFQQPIGNWRQRKRNVEAIPEIAAQVQSAFRERAWTRRISASTREPCLRCVDRKFT